MYSFFAILLQKYASNGVFTALEIDRIFFGGVVGDYTKANMPYTNLFQDKKYQLQLYKALHSENNNVTEDEIADVTIKHVLKDYLESKEQEVVDIMMTLFDDE